MTLRIGRILGLLVMLAAAAAGEGPPLGDEQAAVWRVSQARNEAANRRQLEDWERMTHASFLYTSAAGGLSDRQQSMARLARAPWLERKDFRDIRVQVHGDFALVTYRLTMNESVPQATVVLEQQRTEVYWRQGAAWLALAAHDSDVPVNHRQPAAVDAARLSDYAGVYDFAPGHPDTYEVEGGRLMNVWNGFRQEALPLGGDAFFTRDSLGEIRFVRDGAGKVTGYVWQLADGQQVPARRLR